MIMLFMPVIKALKAFSRLLNKNCVNERIALPTQVLFDIYDAKFTQYQNEMNISCHGITIFSKTFVKYIKCNINYLHPFDVPMKSFSRFMAALMVNENSSTSCFMVITFLGWKESLKRFDLNNFHLNLEENIRRVWWHNN